MLPAFEKKRIVLWLWAFLAFCPKSLASGQVAISEISWAGTNASSADEWIELFNFSTSEISIEGWTLVAQDGSPAITLSGAIPAGDFFLLERTDDTTVSSQTASQIYSGGLGNTGETLILQNGNGTEIDRTPSGAWVAGESSTRATMERVDPESPGDAIENWQTCTVGSGDLDADGVAILGTPKAANSLPPVCLENDTVSILDFLADPTDVSDAEGEWIKLQNNTTNPVDISLWRLFDTNGAVQIHTFPANTELAGSEILQIMRTESGITLNNDTETVVLQDAQGCPVDERTWSKQTTTGSSGGSNNGNNEDNVILKRLVSKLSLTQSVKADAEGLFLKIIEIGFNEENYDFVKVQFFCESCVGGQSLAGVRLASDNSDFEIPPTVFAHHGDILLFKFFGKKEFQQDEQGEFLCDSKGEKVEVEKDFLKVEKSGQKHGPKTWTFFLEKSGLTATDETVFLLDWRDRVFDAFCWANGDGKFSGGEEQDVQDLVELGAWQGESASGETFNEKNFRHPHESICFDSNLIERNFTLVRERAESATEEFSVENLVDTNSKNDFFPAAFTTTEKPVAAESLHITLEQMQFLPGAKARVQIAGNLQDQDWQNLFIFQRGSKVKPVGSGNFELENVSRLGGSFQIRDIFQSVAFTFTWNGNRDSFQFPSQSLGTIVRKENAPGEKRNDFAFVPSDLLPAGKLPLQISEVLPNPDGVDAGGEFVELFARENLQLSDWLLFANGQHMPLPVKKMVAGELFLLPAANLKNTGGQLTLVSPANLQASVHWESAKSGQALAFLNENGKGQFAWTERVTPLARNLPAVKIANKAAENSSVAGSLDFQKFEKVKNFTLRNNQSGKIAHKKMERKIAFAGQTFPHAKVKVFVHSRLFSFETAADESGMWQFDLAAPLEKGHHSVSLLAFGESGERFLKKDVLKFELANDLRQGEIFAVQIAAALPNPTGSDRGAEKIWLANTGNTAGWLRDWQFCTGDLGEGQNCWQIPDSFFQENERKVFTAEKNLRNTSGTLALLNFQHKRVDEIFWEKATAGKVLRRQDLIGNFPSTAETFEKGAGAAADFSAKQVGMQDFSTLAFAGFSNFKKNLQANLQGLFPQAFFPKRVLVPVAGKQESRLDLLGAMLIFLLFATLLPAFGKKAKEN